ncbi:MAG: hypothetical protein UW90_C0010G0001, partial [Candidatus Yanofskybacteria bacterium GW2011_GWB1_45_11]
RESEPESRFSGPVGSDFSLCRSCAGNARFMARRFTLSPSAPIRISKSDRPGGQSHLTSAPAVRRASRGRGTPVLVSGIHRIKARPRLNWAASPTMLVGHSSDHASSGPWRTRTHSLLRFLLGTGRTRGRFL